MKKLLFIIALPVFIISSACAQSWCPAGAEWYFTAYRFYTPVKGYYKLSFKGNTIVDGQTYQMIESNFTGYNPMTGAGIHTTNQGYYLTREQNNVVYMGLDTLYNFNANVGDKWLRVRPGHGFSGIPSQCATSRRTVTVLDTGHSIINSVNLKWLKLSYEFQAVETLTNTASTSTTIAYQKIGDIFGRFDPSYCEAITQVTVITHNENPFGGFRCYKDDNFSTFQSPTYSLACDYTVTDIFENVFDKNNFIIAPNPSQSFINIYHPALKGKNINVKLFNLIGEMVDIQNYIQTTEQVNVDLNNLDKGVYFLNLELDNKTILQEKIIKE